MSSRYRLMMYFVVATFHLYRDDIVPLKKGESAQVFRQKNAKIIDRVFREALNLFNYELSVTQMDLAIVSYCEKAKPITGTRPSRLSKEVAEELAKERR
jgi:hypothetical protein